MHTGKLPKACECYRQVWALREVHHAPLLLRITGRSVC